eukprot:5991135-Prymnesium_polylepis.1
MLAGRGCRIAKAREGWLEGGGWWRRGDARGAAHRSSQMLRMLSLPPEASRFPAGDHLRPHTSCVCPLSVPTRWSGTRTSWCSMVESRPPDDSSGPFQESDETRAL